MYMQSHDEAGREPSASASETVASAHWRHLPPEASGTAPASTEDKPAYEENLQTVLEDSERHLDALWNMLNSQMNRLSSGYTPTTEAQSMSVPPVGEHTERVEAAEEMHAEFASPASQEMTAHEEKRHDEPTEETPNVEAAVSPLALAMEVEEPPTMETPSADQEESAKVVGEAETAVELPASAETFAADLETETEPLPMPHAEIKDSESPDTVLEPSWSVIEPEPLSLSPSLDAQISEEPALLTESSDAAVTTPIEAFAPMEAPADVEVPQEAPRTAAPALPAVRVESTFRDNWMVVTAREAGGVGVLPTVKMMMQSQPNQSLRMRSTALGEMPTRETPLVVMESQEEAGSEPAGMRVEIAYTPDAPDVVFEVASQVEDEVQITMSDQGGDLCASWEVSKQKGKYARAKATVSRLPGDPEVVVELQRFREDADPSVWHSVLSFSIAPK